MSRNPSNCPKCDSPLNAGQCDLCRSIESITANITEQTIPEVIEKVWNWEQFFTLVANDEIAITSKSTDDEIQSRIEALQELDKQTDLLRQSIRIRIQTDGTELEARGKAPKKLPKSKMADFSDSLPKLSKVPKTKLEKTKDSLAELGIDFDKLMKFDI